MPSFTIYFSDEETKTIHQAAKGKPLGQFIKETTMKEANKK
jgi:hypothetical protein